MDVGADVFNDKTYNDLMDRLNMCMCAYVHMGVFAYEKE